MKSLRYLPRTSGVYRIVNAANEKVYLGSAEDLYTRAHVHFSQLRHGNHHNKHLQSAWNEYGSDAFVFEIVELVEKESLRAREQFFMDELQVCKVGYNLSEQSDRICLSPQQRAALATSQIGRMVSDETRRKISATLTGRSTGPKSEETKRKMSDASRGVRKSKEHCANVAKARARQDPKSLSHPHTEQTKAKIGELARARYLFRHALVGW